MTWTTPPLWTTRMRLTATRLNALMNNLTFLKERPFDIVQTYGVDYTVSAVALSAINDTIFNLDISVPDCDLVIGWSFTAWNTAATTRLLSLSVLEDNLTLIPTLVSGGANFVGQQAYAQNIRQYTHGTFFRPDLAAGAHNYKLRAMVDAGSVVIRGTETPIQFWAFALR